jgi:hypothetical protein
VLDEDQRREFDRMRDRFAPDRRRRHPGPPP